MTKCDFLERHFTLAAAASEISAHHAECESCRAQSQELIRLDALYTRLTRPGVPETLKARWRSISTQTLDCDTACELLARSLEGPLELRSSSRLEFHLTRCG